MSDTSPQGRPTLPMTRRPVVGVGLGVAILVLLGLLGLNTLGVLNGNDNENEDAYDSEGRLQSITIVEPAFAEDDEQPWLVHLGFTPGEPGDNEFQVQVTDWEGDPVPEELAPTVASHLVALQPDMPEVTMDLQHTDPDDGMWADNTVSIPDEGWWNVQVTVEADDVQSIANFHLVLPDPNINGFESVNRPEADPEAETLFQTALEELTSVQALNWVERISSGHDVLVVSDRNVTASGDDGDNPPAAYDASQPYTAGFRDRADGSPPAPPRFNATRTITIGSDAWRQVGTDEWIEQNPVRFGEPANWGSIYPSPDHFQFGGTQEVAGEESQVITFYTPNESGLAEAFYVWWVGLESGMVHQVAMIAPSHYMIWEYERLSDDFTIEPPDPEMVIEDPDGADTPATPDAPTMPQPAD